MAYHKPEDPGSINAWKGAVALGVRRAMRRCASCGRSSAGGTRRLVEERVTVWRCRYCGLERAPGLL